MIGITFDTEVSKVYEGYLAKCPEIDLEVFGKTKEEAIEILKSRTQKLLEESLSEVNDLN
jgi:hypothetical protein